VVREFGTPAGKPYDAPMFALVWHYWIGVAVALGAVATVAALAAGYLRNVESPRFPRES
jgi:hypothetical protein